MKFKTLTGSTYEIDLTNKKIRRVSGLNDPTQRQGADGDWRNYDEVIPSPIEIDKSVVIYWGKDVPLLSGSPSNAIPVTMTSPVVSIEI